MKCPICGGTTTVASTAKSGVDFVKRKRMCVKCKRYFYTMERFDDWTKDKKFDFEKANYDAQRALEYLPKDDDGKEIGVISPEGGSDHEEIF